MRIALFIAGLMLLAGCAAPKPVVLGTPPTGTVQPVSAIRSSRPGQTRMVSGVIVEKCPVAGCWFNLKDSTGVLRVDTKNAGFAVLDVPLGTRVRVAGRTAHSGPDAMLDATGLQY